MIRYRDFSTERDSSEDAGNEMKKTCELIYLSGRAGVYRCLSDDWNAAYLTWSARQRRRLTIVVGFGIWGHMYALLCGTLATGSTFVSHLGHCLAGTKA